MSKGVYIFIGTVAVGCLGWWVYSKSKAKKSNANDTVLPGSQLDYNKVLKYGVRGQEVSELQQRLGGIALDGIFGPKTEARLKAVKGVIQITLGQM